MVNPKTKTCNIISGVSPKDLCASMVNDFPVQIAVASDPEETEKLIPIIPMLVGPKTAARQTWIFKAIYRHDELGDIQVEGIMENAPPYCGTLTIFSP